LERFETIVVGGGPAGSSCARVLAQAGRSVAVLDREPFPRLKLCAGWITPEVLEALELDPAGYPHRFNTFDRLIVHWKGITFPVKTTQHSIRRFEFDDFLLKRSGAPVFAHTVRHIARADDGFVIDGRFHCRYLVGAGGTRCPVYRLFFRELNPRASERQVVAYEHEFPWQWSDPRCHLWFFEHDLPGYSWYVPKANGFLNIGVGAMADRLKARGEDIQLHWQHLLRTLEEGGLVRGATLEPRGYSYYVRGNVDIVQSDGAFIVGDAAGLATVDLGEGICPAIRSGIDAGRAILENREYRLAGISATSADGIVGSTLLRPLVRAALAMKFPGAVRAAA
jgi:flavin-dependent dehydrogenase